MEELGLWRTPKGNPAALFYRPDANDWNTISSSVAGPADASYIHDEYNLRELELTGTALDIGGFVGSVGIALAVDNPGLRVVIIEPVPDNVRMIGLNVAANHLEDRITVLAAAVAGPGAKEIGIAWDWEGSPTDSEEIANSMHVHRFVGGSTLAMNNPGRPHGEVKVPAWSLSALVKEFGPFSFCKIDCEGGEAEFFKDPNLACVYRWVGEWHPPYIDEAGLHAALDATHDVTTWGTGPGGFAAVLR